MRFQSDSDQGTMLPAIVLLARIVRGQTRADWTFCSWRRPLLRIESYPSKAGDEIRSFHRTTIRLIGKNAPLWTIIRLVRDTVPSKVEEHAIIIADSSCETRQETV